VSFESYFPIFQDRKFQLIFVTIDTVFTLLNWFQNEKIHFPKQNISFPIIADANEKMSRVFYNVGNVTTKPRRKRHKKISVIVHGSKLTF